MMTLRKSIRLLKDKIADQKEHIKMLHKEVYKLAVKAEFKNGDKVECNPIFDSDNNRIYSSASPFIGVGIVITHEVEYNTEAFDYDYKVYYIYNVLVGDVLYRVSEDEIIKAE